MGKVGGPPVQDGVGQRTTTYYLQSENNGCEGCHHEAVENKAEISKTKLFNRKELSSKNTKTILDETRR